MLTSVRRPQLERAVGVLVVAVAAFFVLTQLQVHLLLRDTTPNGGDTGAHVWWPAFMRDHVFPDLRLSGWAPDWYAGFPVGHFYFPIPALLIVFLDLLIPYNVAFKLVTAIGPLLLPAAGYALARGLRAPWPAPPLFALATLPFLFLTPGEHNFNIMGGNLPSTLAGEFSYAIALALALFFLASLAVALETGRRLWLPALLLGLTVMTHGIVTVFAAVGGLIVWIARGPARRFLPAGAIALVAFLLAAVWSLPVVGRVAYMTDMGWAKVTEYQKFLLHTDMRVVIVLAGVALVAGAAYLRRATLELALMAGVFAALFVFLPEGRLWNLRLLPFYLLLLFFLAALGVTEVVNLVRRGLESPRAAAVLAHGGADEAGARQVAEERADRAAPDTDTDTDTGSAAPEVEEAGRRLRSASLVVGHATALVALVGMVFYVNQDDVKDFVPAWAKWNNAGYEGKDAYPEYREIMDTLDGLPVPDGQRLTWERLDRINDYGSDLALELIPYFTEGKIGSMEGLYFESAGTTPYHFLNVAELASQPSNPVRGLEYGNINDDFDRGVQHLSLLGVRFYLAGSDAAKQKACGITDGRTLEQFLESGEVCPNPDLRLVTLLGDAATPPKVARWALFEVPDVEVVEPMRYEPVVLDDVRPRDWLDPSVEWFNNPGLWHRGWAGDGPAEWRRVGAADAATAPLGPRLPAVEVSDVEMGDDHVRFRVDRIGVPVLVKVSYFPNWEVRGARGPWRATPNFMVVVPTEREVELRYGRTPIDRLGIALTLLGVVGLVALARWRPRVDGDPAVGAETEGSGGDPGPGAEPSPGPVAS